MTCSTHPASRALFGLLAAALVLSWPVAAAEIREVRPALDGSGGGLMLVGEIVKGDHDALVRAIGDGGSDLGHLYLASPGGKVHEAMWIGRLVRRLRWATAAPPDTAHGPWQDLDPNSMICASACFFVYAAGIERSGGSLGVHRPYLDQDDYRAFDQGEAEHDYRSSRTTYSKYLEEMDVPHFLIELTFMTPSDDMYWVEPEDVDAFLSGYTTSLQNWIEAQCETLD